MKGYNITAQSTIMKTTLKISNAILDADFFITLSPPFLPQAGLTEGLGQLIGGGQQNQSDN